MTDYRTRIYKEYASRMQNASLVFDKAGAVRWGQAYVTFLKGWLPERKDAAILEVGCGGGRLLYFLKSKGYNNLQGVDISPQQVALARQVSENVVEADAITFLESHRERHDLIIGLDIVEHFQKDEVLRFLDACYNALRPSGRLLLQTPNADSPFGMMCRYGDFTHEIGLNANSLEHLLRLTGFANIEARETGPVIHGTVSFVRYLIWKFIRVILAGWNLVETGNKGSNLFTRVFLISANKVSK